MSGDIAFDFASRDPLPTHLQVLPHEMGRTTREADRMGRMDGPHTMRLAMPASWTEQAHCLDDWKAFDQPISPKTAERLCGACPVRQQCLDAALEEERGLPTQHRQTIRGGKTPSERYELDGSPEIEPSCPREHDRAHYRRRPRNLTVYCSLCEKERDHRRVRCTCGQDLKYMSLSQHRLTKGCARPAVEPFSCAVTTY